MYFSRTNESILYFLLSYQNYITPPKTKPPRPLMWRGGLNFVRTIRSGNYLQRWYR